jgi:6-pyruvoyltetrahydropterin/6-carboxytetrahydropterin synthase
MSFEVGVVAQFTASHHLVGDFGPASLPHSHNYRVEVSARGDRLLEDGTLFDLTLLQRAVAQVISDLDGANLNDLCAAPATSSAPVAPTPETLAVAWVSPNPTAEVVARYVCDRVTRVVAGSGAGLARLRATLWESPEAYASYTADLA